MSLESVNKICPNCNNPNYMVLLGNLSNAYKYKCMNCNSYFNDIDFEEALPGTTTIKIKQPLPITITRCLACGKCECPEFNNELYDPIITETPVICTSCRKAIEWAKERMESE